MKFQWFQRNTRMLKYFALSFKIILALKYLPEKENKILGK